MTANPLTLPTRNDSMARQKALGRRIVGVFPGRYPREIFWALDLLPMEIWDPPIEVGRSGAHLQPTICSVVRLGLELVLQGKCDELDGLLFPHTCDSLQNLASVVHDFLGSSKPCFFFYPPKAPFGEAARSFYRTELEALILALEEHFGPLMADRLEKSVSRGRDLYRLLASLYRERAGAGLDASNAAFYRAVRVVEYLHPDDGVPLLERFLEERKGKGALAGPCVVLSGVLPNPAALLDALDDLDVRVGDDDLLACGRRLPGASDTSTDPLEALTQSFFRSPACSSLNAPLVQRTEELLRRVRQCRARGVIFAAVKFCEPELFSLPRLREALKEQGIPSLVLELEVNQPVSGQVWTRLEAFVELIAQNEAGS
ncbi:MAG: 2-hydroxyacyl-CoA dehydratase family protein [Desulfobacteraceae bacterium]